MILIQYGLPLTLRAALLESRLRKSPLAFSDQTKLVIKENIDGTYMERRKTLKFSFLR